MGVMMKQIKIEHSESKFKFMNCTQKRHGCFILSFKKCWKSKRTWKKI